MDDYRITNPPCDDWSRGGFLHAETVEYCAMAYGQQQQYALEADNQLVVPEELRA